MISIKYLYVIVPVLVLLIGIIWSIIPMSKKKVIKNTNTMFISTKVTNTKVSKKISKLAKKKAKEAKKRAAEKKARADKKKAKEARKKSKKSKRKYRTD